MSQLKAIETHYKGYRFRSRLEARWAVFFDSLGIKWEYEKEGYDLGSLGNYLPDFYISKFPYLWGCWVEIKGDYPTNEELEKARALSAGTHTSAYIFYGQIEPAMGGIHVGTYKHNGKYDDYRVYWQQCPVCGTLSISSDCAGSDYYQCQTCDIADRSFISVGERMGYHWHEGLWINGVAGYRPIPDVLRSTALLAAYRSARSARFEFGEEGARRAQPKHQGVGAKSRKRSRKTC